MLVVSIVSSPVSAAAERTDILPYDVAVPLPDFPECDEPGRFAVLFCAAIDRDIYNQVSIQVWRDPYSPPTLVPLGAYYAFLDADGEVVRDGSFCGQGIENVPRNAESLKVDVAAVGSYFVADDGRTCGVSPFNGYVWLRAKNVESEPVDDEHDCDM